jgi:hypothetical protein
VPAGVDIEQPSVARVYDYYLGGSHNFAADRAFAAKVMAALPSIQSVIQENRGFLRRAVRFLVEAGVDQFVDLGSGIPTVGNVHEVAQALNPAVKVAYVDHDPVAIAHSRALLADTPGTTVVKADLRHGDSALADPALNRLIDLSRPVAVLIIAVLHFVPDIGEARTIVDRVRKQLTPGSYIALSHASAEGGSKAVKQTEEMYSSDVTEMAMRSRAEIASLFGSMRLVEPGVVTLPMWRPELPEEIPPEAMVNYPGYGGVGHVD